jgi:hypothetical protein
MRHVSCSPWLHARAARRWYGDDRFEAPLTTAVATAAEATAASYGETARLSAHRSCLRGLGEKSDGVVGDAGV